MDINLALVIAKELKNEFDIGSSSSFCDEAPDFDPATDMEIAEVILKTFNANSRRGSE